MKSEHLSIGALATRTMCSVPTIRYYEEIGLLPQPRRSANGRRHYGEADQKRLQFIKRCRDFGFPIDQVRNLLGLFDNGDRSCTEVRDMAQDHLIQVRTRMEELRQLEQSLLAFVKSCDEACIGGLARDCTIIEDLSNEPTQQGIRSCCSGLQVEEGDNALGFREVRRH